MATFRPPLRMRAHAEGEVLDTKGGDLADPESGLDGEYEQGVITATELSRLVGRGEQGIDFGSRQEGDEVPIESLLGHGEDALDERAVCGLACGNEVEEGADRGESSVP